MDKKSLYIKDAGILQEVVPITALVVKGINLLLACLACP
jgi:hypothetical protein